MTQTQKFLKRIPNKALVAGSTPARFSCGRTTVSLHQQSMAFWLWRRTLQKLLT